MSDDFSSVKLHALVPNVLAGCVTPHQGETWLKSASGYTFIKLIISAWHFTLIFQCGVIMYG